MDRTSTTRGSPSDAPALRVLASGVAALAVGGVLYLVEPKAFALAYVLQGTMVAIAASAVLDWVVDSSSLLAGSGIHGPAGVVAASIIGGFALWWAVVFAIWSLVQPIKQRVPKGRSPA
jgi:hypothetical protein